MEFLQIGVVNRSVYLLASAIIAAFFAFLAVPSLAFAEDGDGSIEAFIGLSALEAKDAAESQGLEPKILSSDGKDVTSAVTSEGGDSKTCSAKVVSAEKSQHLFGPDTVDLVLDYSVEKRLKGCVGATAKRAAVVSGFCQYDAEFYSVYGTNVTSEVVGAGALEKAKKAKVTGVELSHSFLMGDVAEFSIDYKSRALDPKPKITSAPVFTYSDIEVTVEEDLVELTGVDAVAHKTPPFRARIKIWGTITNDSDEVATLSMVPHLCENGKMKESFGSPEVECDDWVLEPGESYPIEYEEMCESPFSSYAIGAEEEDKAEIRGVENISDEIGGQLEDVYASYEELAAQYASERLEARKQATCYITQSGTQYHRDRHCRSLARSTSLQEMTVGEAESLGYGPCDLCIR